MEKECCLHELRPGDVATVRTISDDCRIRRRLRDIGLIDGTRVECVGKSPCGDPKAYLIRGAVIAIRKEDARLVRVLLGGDRDGTD